MVGMYGTTTTPYDAFCEQHQVHYQSTKSCSRCAIKPKPFALPARPDWADDDDWLAMRTLWDLRDPNKTYKTWGELFDEATDEATPEIPCDANVIGELT